MIKNMKNRTLKIPRERYDIHVNKSIYGCSILFILIKNVEIGREYRIKNRTQSPK
tara:strand:- start:319 stop:483 length:165 start_codon:yes stop_codon:yes gene_type:complete